MKTLACLMACLMSAVSLTATGAAAMKVTPFKVKLEPTGYQSSQLFTVENDSDRKIAVELSAQTRDLDNNGTETNQDASGDFTIYPSQAIIEPHANRSVRVQWIGKAPVDREKAYRLTVEELPVDLDPGQDASAVRFLVQYRCALYVTPPAAKSDVRMTAHDVAATPKGEQVDFTLNNDGSAHSLIKNFTLVLTDKNGQTHELSDPKVLASVNSEVLMPGSERRFSVLLPADAGADITDVNFKFAEAF